MASNVMKFCTAARQIGLKRISTSQSMLQCAKSLNTRLLIYPVYTCTSNFSSSVNRYTAKSLTRDKNKTLKNPEELDVLYKSIELEYKCHDTGVIRSYQKFIQMAAKELDIPISKIYTPKRDITHFAVLKSVHIYKKHKVQYEARTHYKLIELKHITESTANTFLEYIQRNLPEGVAMKITITRLEPLPEHILQDQIKRESESRRDHMFLEGVEGVYQENSKDTVDSAPKTIETASESVLDAKKESVVSKSAKDDSDADSDKSSHDSDSSSDSGSDSSSDSDSESMDKKAEQEDSKNDENP